MTLRLLSSNLLAERPYRKHGLAGHLAFDVRVARMSALVAATRPDLLLLQEVDDGWREALADVLAARGYTVVLGPCWSSGLAIGLRADRLQLHARAVEDAAAGLLGVEVLDAADVRPFLALNLHAPWRKAVEHAPVYREVLRRGGAMIVGGDGNFDGEGNTNRAEIDGALSDAACGCRVWTDDVPFTARSVHTDAPETLDFMAGRGFRRVAWALAPVEVDLLLPHAARARGALDLANPALHFSDHAALVVDVAREATPWMDGRDLEP